MPSRKRKRDAEPPAAGSTSRDAISAIFQRHFESKFGAVELNPVVAPRKPKPSKSQKPQSSDPESSEDDSTQSDSEEPNLSSDGESVDEEGEGDDWDGLDSNPPQPEVITYDFSRRGPPPSTKPSSHRSFMSSKPPSSITAPTASAYKQKQPEKDDESETLNLQNDLALHRLLRESHLLDQKTLSHSSASNRQKAIESRIQSLGGTPLVKLTNSDSKIPMHIRKGMAKKEAMRVEKKKKVARENGIVVAKEKKKKRERKREGGVGGPSVGKFKRGALVLSKRDVGRMRA
ncbi:hypothetical protein TWF694_006494 [Orbilia ellipsospora]|uniref:Protein FAF1 n=1 Tax=Orbilia ellipsospora TaxID=2528407 RepID=A0AAV9XLT7_9PEZI